MIEEGVLALANKATAAVLNGRFYADTVPKGVTIADGAPVALIKAGIGGSSLPTFDGPGLRTDRYQFDFGATKRRVVSQLRELLVASLDQFGGLMPNGDRVELIDFIQPLSLPFDSDRGVYWCGCEFYVTYNP